MTKTIEYPIKELVRFEMDENKIWWLRYDREHECFPLPKKKVKTKYGDKWRKNKKGYEDFIWSVSQFCKEQNFTLEGEGFGMVSSYDRRVVSWSDKEVLCYSLPTLLTPITQSGCVFSVNWEFHNPLPYYGNPHYKKYIEDNNGECLLPLPEDVKWWEV